MRHNGYCWEHLRKRYRNKKKLDNARRSYFRARMAQLSAQGWDYGFCVWNSTWDSVRLYGSATD